MEELQKIICELESISNPINESEIADRIRKIRGDRSLEELSTPLLSESLAFDFYEHNLGENTDWGTYFGPMFSRPLGDNNCCEYPSMELLTLEVLEYWAKRARECKHPVLSTRYAGLVWDLSKEAIQVAPDIEMAHLWIDGVIQIAKEGSHKYEVDVIEKLKKILSLAIAINDPGRIDDAKEAILKYQSTLNLTEKRGLWPFAFDSLLMNKKITLSASEIAKIVCNLEQKLEKVSSSGEGKSSDPHNSEAIAVRLAQYYRSKGNQENVARVLFKYRDAFLWASEKADAPLAIAWLQKVESVLRDFGFAKESDMLLNIIRERGADAEKFMKPVSFTKEISSEEMNGYVNEILKDNLQDSIVEIVGHYIPDKNAVITQMEDLAKRYPVQFLFSTSIQDRQGRTVASIGTLEEDIEGHIARQVAQNMQISAVFLRNVLEEFFKRFDLTPEKILKLFLSSPIFLKEKEPILRRGLEACFANDHITAIHLLVPQVENSIRRLLELCGGTTFRRASGSSSGYNLRLFGDMLRDDLLTKVLGEDVVCYFNILYTDPRGWNLRNDLCHGMAMPGLFCPYLTDRVFHTLLLLSLIKENKKN